MTEFAVPCRLSASSTFLSQPVLVLKSTESLNFDGDADSFAKAVNLERSISVRGIDLNVLRPVAVRAAETAVLKQNLANDPQRHLWNSIIENHKEQKKAARFFDHLPYRPIHKLSELRQFFGIIKPASNLRTEPASFYQPSGMIFIAFSF